MKITESECVDCGLPCIHKSCPYYEVTRFICDKCGAEETLYEFDGQELCLDCISKLLPVVQGSDRYG